MMNKNVWKELLIREKILDQGYAWCIKNLKPNTWSCTFIGGKWSFRFDNESDEIMFLLSNELIGLPNWKNARYERAI